MVKVAKEEDLQLTSSGNTKITIYKVTTDEKDWKTSRKDLLQPKIYRMDNKIQSSKSPFNLMQDRN